MAEWAAYIDDKPPRRTWWRSFFRHLPALSVLVLSSLLVTLVLWPYIVVTVPSGEVGVLWRRFYGFDFYCRCFAGRGTTLDPRELREEGLHIIWPWDHLFLYDLRLQSATKTYNAISKDGVSVNAQISVRFQLRHDSVAVLHKFIGPQYLETVLDPEIGSQTRQVISQYTAEEVYTHRDKIEAEIRDNSRKSLGENLNTLIQSAAVEQLDPKHYNNFLQNSIQILDTLVLGIDLPPAIVEAINRQTEQYYMIQEYKFRVQREAEESRRKQIEANGIAAFQNTVSKGISDSYLRWRGIEATLALAQSPNTKIVIIGGGKEGLPIILGNVDNSPAPPAAPAAGGTGASGAPGSATPPNPPGSPAKTPPGAGATGAPPASSGAPPGSGGPTGTTPPAGTENGKKPAAPGKASGADAAKPPAGSDIPGPSQTTLDLSQIEALLARLTAGLHAGGTPAPSAPSAPSPQPKQ